VNQATLMKTPMEAFLEGVAAAGFTGVELRRDETFAYLETHSASELKQCLDKLHLEVVSWNAIELFSLCSEADFEGMLDYSERLMKIGNQIGCDLIIAVPSFLPDSTFPAGQTIPKTVERFQVLRKLASKYKFRMGFEPLGFPANSVRKVDAALRILEAAESDGLPRSGLVVDTFHYFLGGHPATAIGSVPKERLWLVHFNDCVEKPLDELQDSDRVWPGSGFFDLAGFVAGLKATGYDGYVSLEIFNPAYWREDPNKAMETGFAALKKFF
ncbi:MAG: sugar phosphate isomerase/epimerase, partial [Candidatus Lokiarchaeota archaeon]|nr:sugar phosphate isomerase/epimerase [Candidatus Lokiarchaeota archaeon]